MGDTHGMNGRAGSPVPSLVGREAELGSLRQALDDASAGRGSCWFVLGEPGLGDLTGGVVDGRQETAFSASCFEPVFIRAVVLDKFAET